MSDAARDAILENRIYRNLSGALAGVADYMAMEKLLELAANPATDLLVLDTPPATEAIDFLDAPRRLLELLNSRAISLLGAPAGLFRSQLRVIDIAARAVLAAFDRVTGLNLLSDVQSFVRSFDGMYEGFSARAAARAQASCARPIRQSLSSRPRSRAESCRRANSSARSATPACACPRWS